jgi:hypothetical protein
MRRSVWKGIEKQPKTEAGFREVFIDAETSGVLGEHIAGRTGLVFKTRNGTHLADGDVLQDTLHAIFYLRQTWDQAGWDARFSPRSR